MRGALRARMFTSLRFLSLSVLVLASFAGVPACSSADEAPAAPPDAAPPRHALDPSGTFIARSTYALSAPPKELAPLLAELATATDDYDDPSGYLVDLIVAQLPEGTPRTIATALAPYVASYVQARIDMYAPDLAPGLHAMATGAARIATRFETVEELRIVADVRDDAEARLHPDDGPNDGANDGATASTSRTARAHRAITGVAFDDVAIAFDDVGLATPGEDAAVTVETFDATNVPDRIAFAKHAIRVPYGAWFRVGFDRAVIPAVVPGATDLASALRALVRCPRLGALIADALGVGSPSLYASACSIGLGVGARAIYERFPSVADARAYDLSLAGEATAIDRDDDGVMDAIIDGRWTGQLGESSVASSRFEGAAR